MTEKENIEQSLEDEFKNIFDQWCKSLNLEPEKLAPLYKANLHYFFFRGMIATLSFLLADEEIAAMILGETGVSDGQQEK